MQPRFIIKTHIGALNPANYSLLIAKCTYPDASAYPEKVIKKLQDWIKEKSVAKFTVLLSTSKNRGFGFLRDNMIWSWKGHVINTVLHYANKKESNNIDRYNELTMIEMICYMRYFLETEGAIILKLAERFHKVGDLSYSYLKDSIQEIFKEIYEEYIDIAQDFSSRIKIQEAYKLMKTKEKYDESTLAHKIKPHMQALEKLGIVIEEGNIYKPRKLGGAPLTSILFAKLINIGSMEKLFDDYEYYSLISEIYNLSITPYLYEAHNDLLKECFTYGYNIMKDKATGMADIEALIDWCCIKMLSEHRILLKKQDIENFLNKIKKERPSKIRYHVDGKGKIAYLIFSEE